MTDRDLDRAAGWRLKLDRARKHIDDLTALIDEFLKRGPYRLEQVSVAPHGHGVRLHIVEEPPAELALVVGDAVHNMRSALDVAFIDAAARVAGRPLRDEEARILSLPIERDEPAFLRRSDWSPKVIDRRVCDRLRGVARAVQAFGEPSPYWPQRHGTSTRLEDVETQTALGRALADLASLSNEDKHRGLHFAWWAIDHLFAATDGREVRWTALSPPWTDGDIVTLLTPADAADRFEPVMQGRMTLGLPRLEMVDQASAADQLSHLHFWSWRAAEILEFESGPRSNTSG